MLAHILAVLVGTGSVGLYIAAFFFPEIHRKHDFIWSGVGLFYALALWIYARQTTGGILVGQMASVALLGWFGWQTLKLRRQIVPVDRQTPIPTATQIQQQLGLKPTGAKPAKPAKPPTKSPPSATTPPTAKPTPSPTPAPTVQAPVVPPVSTAAQTKDRSAVPAQVAAPTAAPITPARVQTPVVPPAAPVTPARVQTPGVPPVSTTDRAAVPAQVDAPTVRAEQTQPTAVPPATDEAWISLEIKPSPTVPKPLGQAVKPPIAPPEPTQLPAITAESVSRNVPTDTIKTTVQLDNVEHNE